ncbi:MAG TPA: family 16 glycoside hydrolase, partial [Gemmataceae bacterium]|nr:family 16 glycoside hydrolase [Gemmataceae bacterium]
YGDFHLRAEMRISDDGSGSLSFRYPFLPAEIDKGRPGGNHVRLSGKVNDFFAKTGGIMIYEKVGLRNLVAKEALMQPGKWFNLEIIAEGNLLTTKVNGQQAVQFDNPKTHLAGGRIVLRADATIRPTTLEVRKLEIKEFKKVAAPPQPPPEGPLEAFVPLFNGKDLDGWRVEGNAGFKVENGEIVGMGPNTALISKRADYRGVIVKVRLAASADVEAYFAFRQNTEDGKLKGLTSRITGDGVGVKLGYVGTDGNKLESGNQQLRLRPGEFGDVEFHVRHDLMKVLGNGKHVGGLGYAPDRYPPGAIGLHVVKGSVRIEKIEISAEAPIGQVPVNPPPAAADFAPLFNGKDLDGWKSNRVVGWRVFNGLLVGVGNDIGELYTQRSDYGDFHLRVEGRINASANSMIMFRYPFGADELARSTMGGYAAVITGREADAQKTGSLHFFDGAAPRSFPARVQLIQPGQWFTLDAIAVGNQVTIRVNGVTTATYKNPKDTFLGGRIVLGFGDTNKKTLIEYRKIEIKEFKAVAAPPPPAVAILRDWTPLYNGKNLAGWRDDGGKGTWHVTPDGTLVGNAPNAWILTERKDLKNFNVKIQLSADEDVEAFLAMRQNAAPEGKWLGLTSRIFFDGVKVRVGLAGADGSKVEKGERQLQVKPGTPFNLEFQVRGDNMKVLANGTVTANMAYPADKHPPGAFGLLVSKGCVRITKIELAEEVTRAAAKFVPVGEPVPLFNGKDLTGWQALDDAKGKWRVENGILVGDGFAPGVLHTTKADFKDYHLRMEARFTVTPNGAGQIVVRSADGVTGCEARFAKNRFTGSVYLSGENFGKPIAAKDPAEVASGDWFTLDVFAQGNRIIVKVNGKETTDFVDDDNLLKTGRIALKHGGNCKLEVRKADWQELKAIEVIAAKPPEPMPVAKGNFVPLFNGKDLDGWQPHAKRPGNWKVENGILIGSAPVGGSLYTRRADYRDFHLRAEVRLNDKGFGRIFCRAAYEPTKIPFKVLGYEVLLNQRPVGEKTGTLTARSTGHTSAIEAKDPPAPADWTVVDIIAVGDLVTVKVNGNITAEFRDSKGDFARSGHIALHQDANAVVEFRRVEIEDLSGRAEKK